MEKELRVYRIILAIVILVMTGFMCSVSHANKSEEKVLASNAKMVELGNDVENFILDVVYETDLFEDITEEEQKYLDELEESWYGRYCIELIMLYQKYYGDK